MAVIDLKGMAALVIDSKPAGRELLTTMLQELGVSDIRRSPDGRHGLDVLRQFTPDFIVCAISMDEMTGIEFTKKVRTDPISPNPFVAIFMLTGDARIEMVREARDAGANGFLAKPISGEVLRKRLVSTMAENRAFIRSQKYTGPDRRRRDIALGHRTDRRRPTD
ncbi:MAG: response regulator [Proteobacteria bacterium]|nr:response regulator [Pseudomonadota bacterium]MDA1310820.1 response regulator [Pseudomonadota bacterium]